MLVKVVSAICVGIFSVAWVIITPWRDNDPIREAPKVEIREDSDVYDIAMLAVYAIVEDHTGGVMRRYCSSGQWHVNRRGAVKVTKCDDRGDNVYIELEGRRRGKEETVIKVDFFTMSTKDGGKTWLGPDPLDTGYPRYTPVVVTGAR